MSTFALFFIAVVVGVGIGMLSGLLGIGGGMIMVPVFRLAFGMSAVASTATSLFTIIPTSVSGAVTRVRNKTCIPKLGIALGVGGALTSPLGVWLAQLSPSWLVMAAAALVIAYSAITMLRKALGSSTTSAQQGERAKRVENSQPNSGGKTSRSDDATGHPAVPDKQPEAKVSRDSKDKAPASGFAAPVFSMLDFAKAVAIGSVAGVASGYVGLGGGFIMVPLMVSLMNMPMRLASGTSLIAVMILATPATIMQCALGNVDYLVGVAVACGSIPGAVLGARLSARVPERTMRLVFAAFLGVAAVLLIVREAGLLSV